MKSKAKIILVKILKYIEELHEFIHGYTHDRFEKDKKTINGLCI